MTHEPPQDDPKAVWKNLRPGARISAEEVRAKAKKLDSNIRAMNITTAFSPRGTPMAPTRAAWPEADL